MPQFLIEQTRGGVKAWKRIRFGWVLTEEHKFGRPSAVKYENYRNDHFSGASGAQVLGAAWTLPCIATAKSITKMFNSQEGVDTKLSELTLPTALGPDLQLLLLCQTCPQAANAMDAWKSQKGMFRMFRSEGNPGAQWFFTNRYRYIWIF